MDLAAVLLVCLFSVCLKSGYTRAQPIDLQFALFTAGPGGGFDSSGSVPAVEIAEEQILRSETLLNGYRLTHTAVQDTKCNRTNSLNLFFQMIPSVEPPVLGLLGCGCSVASEPVAEIIHHWNISQISYGSSSVTLNDRTRFVNYFRTAPSDETLLVGISTVIQNYGWEQIVLFTQMENLFDAVSDGLMNRNETGQMNISVTNIAVPSKLQDVSNLVSDPNFFNFQRNDNRVFFLNTYSNVARIIICEAFKRNLTYPRYVWLTYGWYMDKWWTSKVNDFSINCTDDELASFIILSRFLAVQTFPAASTSNEPTDTILTPNQFYTEYNARLNTTEAQENNYTFVFTGTTAYDATWTLAFALNETASMINDSSEEILTKTGCRSRGGSQIVPLEDFTYDNDLMGCVIRSHLMGSNFSGVSGDVQFDETGTRSQTEISVGQYRLVSADIELDKFATVHSKLNGTFVYDSGENNETVFPLGIPPDGQPLEMIVTYHLALVIIYDALAAAGLVFTTVCLVFNFVFRNRKVVRLTSPNLNYFIIISAYVMYFTIFIRIIPTTNINVLSVTCNLEMFLTIISYSLAFGTILVKMGRVYHIFHNPTERKKPTLQDWKLALIVLGITGVGAFLSILTVAVPQLRATPYLVNDNEIMTTENELGVRIEYHSYQCFGLTDGTAVLIILIYVYLALLQIIGLVLAIQTRKVTVKVLNDSKYIAALIYISNISLVVLALTTFTLRNFTNLYQVLYSGGLLLAITAFLGLIFIPKMVSLYQDPNGEKIFETSSPSETGGGVGTTAGKLSIGGYGLGSTVDSGGTNEMENLKSKVAELEAELSQYQRKNTNDKIEDIEDNNHVTAENQNDGDTIQ